MQIQLNNHEVKLKNLDKVYFETAKKDILKAEVIEYYIRIAPYLLPHLEERPFSMIFFPEGKAENSFYQKQAPADAPDWLSTVRIPSKRRGHIDWCILNNAESLVYMANKSVIEMHAWFSRVNNLEKPDMAVLDLDPSGETGIAEAVVIAKTLKKLLDYYGIKSYPKTSGSRGIHIFVPIIPKYSYEEVQAFLAHLCRGAITAHPELCTTERLKAKRGDKIYLDAVQCNYGKTLAMPYSLRVKSSAPVSTPLKWSEVNANLDPKKFNIRTIFDRIERVGDLMADFYDCKQKLPTLH